VTCQKEEVEQNEIAASASVSERLGADTGWSSAVAGTDGASTDGKARRQTGKAAPARRDGRRRRRPHAATSNSPARPLTHRHTTRTLSP